MSQFQTNALKRIRTFSSTFNRLKTPSAINAGGQPNVFNLYCTPPPPTLVAVNQLVPANLLLHPYRRSRRQDKLRGARRACAGHSAMRPCRQRGMLTAWR